ncbi:MAG: NAD-dependent epimerase/dehydratase family protein [Methyloceanibacter sp.]
MLKHHHLKPVNPSRVVVLGGRGFIGSALRAVLERAGIATLAPTRAELDLAVDGAGDRLVDVLQPGDAIVMLAALTPDKGRGLQPFLANIRMAASLCHALTKVTPSHVVYFSSDSVYPMTTGLITETSCTEPDDLYGMMHLAREMMITSVTKAPIVALRPTLVYGAADTHNSYGPNRLRRMAHKDGKIALFGQGEETRDHILVEDVAALAVLALRHRSAGTLNVATGRSITYAELAKTVAALFDKPVEIIGAARQTPITHRHFDVTALRKAFPMFVFTPLEDGLAKAHREMMEQE